MGILSGISKLAGTITGGDVLSAGTSLLGGALADKGAKDANKIAARQFAEQMDTSIQRRVADAKKAGIHPLYAIGASAGASPTIMAGQHTTGSGVGQALASVGSNIAQSSRAAGQSKRIQEQEQYNRTRFKALDDAAIQRDKAAAARDMATAQATLSAEARAAQASNQVRSVQPYEEIAQRKRDETKPVKNRVITTRYGKHRVGPWTDQQAVEDIYGGGIGELYGFMRALNDSGSALGIYLANRKERLRKGRVYHSDENIQP